MIGRFMRRHGAEAWSLAALLLWLGAALSGVSAAGVLAFWGLVGLSVLCAGAAAASSNVRRTARR